jgi:hypothetical protein
MKQSVVALSVLAVVLLAGPALGHHASNLDYDQSRIGTIEGVVEDIFWSNPHIHFYLTVTNADGGREIWDMEGPNLSSLSRRGMTRDSVSIGDTISISGTLGRDGHKRIWAESIVAADGTVVMGERQ